MRVIGIQRQILSKHSSQSKTGANLSFQGDVNFLPSVKSAVSPAILEIIKNTLAPLRRDAFLNRYSVSIQVENKIRAGKMGNSILKMIFTNDEDASIIIPDAFKRLPLCKEIDLPSNLNLREVKVPIAERKISPEGLFGVQSSSLELPPIAYKPSIEIPEESFAEKLDSEAVECLLQFKTQEHAVTIN